MIYLKKIKNIPAHIIAFTPAFSVLPRFYIKPIGSLYLLLTIYTLFSNFRADKKILKREHFGIFVLVAYILYIVSLFGLEELRYQFQSGLFVFFVGIATIPIHLSKFLTKRAFFERFIQILSFSSIFLGLTSLLQFFGVIPVSDSSSIYSFYHGAAYFRSTGFFPHATSLGLYFLFAIFILSKSFVESRKTKPLLVIALFFCFLGVASSFGRMVTLCSYLALFTFVLFRFRGKLFFKKRILTLLCLFALVLPTFFFFKEVELFRRFSHALKLKSNGQRVEEVKFALSLLRENIHGYGANNLTLVANNKILEKKSKGDFWEFNEWRGVHFYPLNHVLNTGLIGYFFYLAFLFLPFFIFKNNRGSATLYLLSLALSLIYNITDSFIFTELAFFEAAVFCFLLFPASENVKERSLKKQGVILFLLLPLFLSSIRTIQIKGSSLSRIFVENNTSSLKEIFIDERKIEVPSKEHRVWNTLKKTITYKYEGREELVELFPYKEASKTSYLIMIGEGEESNLSAALHENNAASLVIYRLPKEFGEPYYSKSNDKFRKSWFEKSGFMMSSLCWEPTWLYFFKDPNFSLCHFGKQYSPYGKSALDKQKGFIKYLLQYSKESQRSF